MTNVVLLNSHTHRDMSVDPNASAALGDNQRFVPIIVNEVPLLAIQCPILLSKNADTGAFLCGAMLGFELGENLFLREGKGHDGHRPLYLQRGAFYTVGPDLGVDLDSPRINPSAGGQRLFNDEGQPTAYLESIANVMRDLTPGNERTKLFIDTLLGLKLIEPVDVKLSFDDGADLELTGLYTIDQGALRDLPDDKALDLFRRGYLQLIYLMISSLKHIPSLVQRRNQRMLEGTGGLAGALG